MPTSTVTREDAVAVQVGSGRYEATSFGGMPAEVSGVNEGGCSSR